MEGIEKIKEAFEIVAKRLREVVKTFSEWFHQLLDKIHQESNGSKKKTVVDTRSDVEKWVKTGLKSTIISL